MKKLCTKCGELKRSDCFVKDKHKLDGLYSSCNLKKRDKILTFNN